MEKEEVRKVVVTKERVKDKLKRAYMYNLRHGYFCRREKAHTPQAAAP